MQQTTGLEDLGPLLVMAIAPECLCSYHESEEYDDLVACGVCGAGRQGNRNLRDQS